MRCRKCGTVNRVSNGNLNKKIVCGNCKQEIELIKTPLDVNGAVFQQEVLKDPGIVLAEFWSPTCVHCRQLDPVLREIASEKSGLMKIARVNTMTEPELSSRFGIQGVPTMILFRGGQTLSVLPGALPKFELLRWLHSSAGV